MVQNQPTILILESSNQMDALIDVIAVIWKSNFLKYSVLNFILLTITFFACTDTLHLIIWVNSVRILFRSSIRIFKIWWLYFMKNFPTVFEQNIFLTMVFIRMNIFEKTFMEYVNRVPGTFEIQNPAEFALYKIFLGIF